MFSDNRGTRRPMLPQGQPQGFAFNRQPEPMFQRGAPRSARSAMMSPAQPTPPAGQSAPLGRSQQARDFSALQNQVQQQYGITDPQQANRVAQMVRADQAQDPAMRQTYQNQLSQQGLPNYEQGSFRFVNGGNVNQVSPEFGDAAFNQRIGGYDKATQEQLMAERNKDLSRGWMTGTPVRSGEIGINEPRISTSPGFSMSGGPQPMTQGSAAAGPSGTQLMPSLGAYQPQATGQGQAPTGAYGSTYGSQQQGPGMETAGAYQTQPFGAGLSGALAGSFGFQKPGLDATGQNPQMTGQYGFGGASGAYSGAMPMNYGGLL